MNGSTQRTARSKRKEPPFAIDSRHPKHHRANDEEMASNDQSTPDEMEDDAYDFDDGRRQSLLSQQPRDTAEWQATIEKVVKNVVSIRFSQTRSFDTDPALTSEATGFVVDAERG